MNEKSDKNVELTDLNEVQEKSEFEKPVTCTQRIRMFFNFFTVEPFLLFYIIPFAISGLAVQKLNLEKACRVDLGMSQDVCLRTINGNAIKNDTLDTEAQTNASILVADMTTWQQPLQSSLPAIVILNVGAWSDKTGNRKALLLIPVIGDIISSIGLLLATYFFLEWPLWATALIEGLPSALTGGSAIALMGSYSLIADMTTVDSRTFRIGMVSIIVTLGVPFGTSISGVLTEAVGYYGIFGISLALYIIGFLYTLFKIKNVRTTKVEGTVLQQLVDFFHPKNVWDTISLLFLSTKKQLIQIILVIIVHFVIMGPVFGESAVLFLYVLNKYSMDVVDFSLFRTYSILMGTAGSAIAVVLFSKKMKMHDSLLGILATACKTMSAYAYALAPTRNWLYAVPAFDLFGNTGAIAVRSLGTKVVDQDKVGKFGQFTNYDNSHVIPLFGQVFTSVGTPGVQLFVNSLLLCILTVLSSVIRLTYALGTSNVNKGKMCSLIGFVESIIPVIYVPLYSKLFANTVGTLPGAVYFLGGTMTIPAFLIFIVLYVLHRRQDRDTVKNPALKEMHTHDNNVSSL